MMNQNMAWDLTALRQFRLDFRFHLSICFRFRWNQFPVSGGSVPSLFSRILFCVWRSSPASLMFLTEIDIDLLISMSLSSNLLLSEIMLMLVIPHLPHFWPPNPLARGPQRVWSTPGSLGGHPLSAVSPGASENLHETLPFPSLWKILWNFNHDHHGLLSLRVRI